MTAEQYKKREEAAQHVAYLCKKYYAVVIDKVRAAEEAEKSAKERNRSISSGFCYIF